MWLKILLLIVFISTWLAIIFLIGSIIWYLKTKPPLLQTAYDLVSIGNGLIINVMRKSPRWIFSFCRLEHNHPNMAFELPSGHFGSNIFGKSQYLLLHNLADGMPCFYHVGLINMCYYIDRCVMGIINCLKSLKREFPFVWQFEPF